MARLQELADDGQRHSWDIPTAKRLGTLVTAPRVLALAPYFPPISYPGTLLGEKGWGGGGGGGGGLSVELVQAATQPREVTINS